MKLFFIDIETTGVDPTRNGVVQISGQAIIEGDPAFDMDYKCRPFGRDILDPEALEVIGYEKDEITGWTDPKLVHERLTDELTQFVDPFDKSDKFIFVGYNSRFDYDHLRAWFKKCGDEYFGSWFFWPAIDVANMAMFNLAERRHEMDNFQLMTVAEEVGIPVDRDKAHDAMYDIEITKDIFFELCSWDKPQLLIDAQLIK